MKRIRIYLIVFGVLAAVSLYFLLGPRSGTNTPSQTDFAVKDTGRIESLWISGISGEVFLTREGSSWSVNGHPARKESVRGLFILVSRLEVESPVSGSAETRIRNGLSDHATQVKISMKSGREKAYRVYHDSISGSTFMMLEGADVPFRAGVRGYRQRNIQELFSVDPGYWRDNRIFHYLPADIRSVFLQNNRSPDKSFHLARNEEGRFEVAGGLVPGTWQDASEERIGQYLGYFYDVRFESFLDPESDTLLHNESPDMVLTLELTSRETISIELFPVEKDFNSLCARMFPGNDWIVVKYIQIDPLLKEFEYFTGL